MRPRTITVRLTDKQFSALGSAVDMTREDYLNHDDRYHATELRTLDRAWERMREAWWG